MSKYTYLSEPGILYDMLFALRLRFNEERALPSLLEGPADQAKSEKFYRHLIDQLSFVSDKMLALFYWNHKTDTKTGIVTHFWNNIDQLKFYEEGFIERFYESLYDIDRLKKTLYANYISKDVPEIFDINTFCEVRETVYATSLPSDVKLYLTDFFLFGEKEIDGFIADLRKTEEICREMNRRHEEKIKNAFSEFDESTVAQLSKIHCIDVSKFHRIHVTYCASSRESITGKFYGEKWISFIGIDQLNYIRTYCNDEINWYELGRVLYDENRLKILKMLRTKKMYCAEIAKELGLKNNSTLYHLEMMGTQGLLSSNKNGKKRLYFINPHQINAIINYLNILLEGTPNENRNESIMEQASMYNNQP